MTHKDSVTSQTFMRLETNIISSKLKPNRALKEAEFDGSGLEHLAQSARPLFKPGFTWVIDALEVTRLSPHARAPLGDLFREFAQAGGRQILVCTPHPHLRSAFQSAAMLSGIPLKLFREMGEIVAALNTAAKKP